MYVISADKDLLCPSPLGGGFLSHFIYDVSLFGKRYSRPVYTNWIDHLYAGHEVGILVIHRAIIQNRGDNYAEQNNAPFWKKGRNRLCIW